MLLIDDDDDDDPDDPLQAIPDSVAEELKQLRGENRQLRERLAQCRTEAQEPVPALREEVFRERARSDPLSAWFPLKQVLRPEARVGTTLCFGPPSATAAHWVVPEPPGMRVRIKLQPEVERESPDTGENVLVQHMVEKQQEMLVAQVPRGTTNIQSAAAELAQLLELELVSQDWEIISVGVGVWLASALLQCLQEVAVAARGRCRRMTVVGFPPPSKKLAVGCVPPGMLAEDLAFARSLEPKPWQLPCPVQVCVFPACSEAFSIESMKGWFKLFESQRALFSVTGLRGDQSLLSKPRLRNEAFYAITRAGVGVAPPAGMTSLRMYRETCIRDGVPPRRGSLFDDADPRLIEVSSRPNVAAFQKHMPFGRRPFTLSDFFVSGQCGVDHGLDVRLYADLSTVPAADTGSERDEGDLGGVGGRLVALVRFDLRATAFAIPATGSSVHGGAISAVMDEITAECMKFFVQPMTSTRKIEHQVLKPIMPYMTYRVDSTVESIKSEGRLCMVKAVMLDLADEVCCISKAEMVNLGKLGVTGWW